MASNNLAPLLYPETFRFLAIFSGALILLSAVVRMSWTLPLDRKVTAHLQYLDVPILGRISRWLTFMGNSSTIIVLAIAATLSVQPFEKRGRDGSWRYL